MHSRLKYRSMKKLKSEEFTTLDFNKEIWKMKNSLTLMSTFKKSWVPWRLTWLTWLACSSKCLKILLVKAHPIGLPLLFRIKQHINPRKGLVSRVRNLSIIQFVQTKIPAPAPTVVDTLISESYKKKNHMMILIRIKWNHWKPE